MPAAPITPMFSRAMIYIPITRLKKDGLPAMPATQQNIFFVKNVGG